MDGASSLPTPMITSHHSSNNKRELILNDKQYRSIIVALQYATITRPEISFSVNKGVNLCTIPRINTGKKLKEY